MTTDDPLYDVARQVSHEFGFDWTDPRTLITYKAPPFTREQWFTLPLKIRRFWWEETDYGKKPPSDELAKCVRLFLTMSEKMSSST